jgi:3-oxoacyl-[acyl-carrier protein] reductase
MNKIVITGASSDIGLSIAKKFAINGNHLVLQCNKNKSKLAEFADNCEIVNFDFADNEAIRQFINHIKGVDILINAAAFTKTDLLVNLTDEEIHKMLQVNIFALTQLCRAAIPQMLVKRKGIIINISSIAASRSNRGQSVYGGTKAFMESFTKTLATEYSSKGLRFNCVAPGAIDAGSLKDLLNQAPEEVKSSISLNKLGLPDDVASIVKFLCSDEAKFINGQVIHVDGGFLRGL